MEAARAKKISPSMDKINHWVVMHLSRISFVQKIFFLDHLRTMIHASLSLVESLDILTREMENKKFKTITGNIKDAVEKGQTLSEVLARYPEVFPSIYVKMVESGEVSGKLDDSLQQIVIQMKKTNALNSSIRSAMIYPGVILTAMGGIGIMMATVVFPKLIEIFKEFDAELPLATRVLIAVIDVIGNPIYLTAIIFSIIFLIGGFVTLLKRIPKFRRTVHRINLHLPIFGTVIKQINLARFSLTLSSLLKSTIPIIDAMEITADTCTNMLYQETLHEAAKRIKTGDPVSVILRASPHLYPPIVTEMIMVGERSGQVDNLLIDLAEFYGGEVDKMMKNFATIIEPVIIVTLGIAIAGVAVAVIMPMYSLVQQF
jgi:type IV pilus assembly protein PilC